MNQSSSQQSTNLIAFSGFNALSSDEYSIWREKHGSNHCFPQLHQVWDVEGRVRGIDLGNGDSSKTLTMRKTFFVCWASARVTSTTSISRLNNGCRIQKMTSRTKSHSGWDSRTFRRSISMIIRFVRLGSHWDMLGRSLRRKLSLRRRNVKNKHNKRKLRINPQL